MAKSETETVLPPPRPKGKPGRPKFGTESPMPAKARTFFERCREISTEDWGARANIHLYRLEPFTDRLRSGNVVYVMKYAEPIDEDRILADHGSGKYRALFTFRKGSSERGEEMDRIEFELLNVKFPPRIPKGEWVEDPRNKKWAWAKRFLLEDGTGEPAPVPPPAPAGDFLEAVRAVNEVRDSVKLEERSQPGALEMIRAVKELLPPPAAPAVENGMLNTVVQLMTKALDNARDEAKELRDEVRQMRSQPLAQNGTGIDKLKEALGAIKDFFPAVKDLFPALKEVTAGAQRSRMAGWQEFTQPIISDILNSPVAQAVGQILILKMTQTGAAPATAGAAADARPASAAAIAAGPMTLPKFFDVIWPSLLRYLKAEWVGSDFAEWVYDGYGCPYEGIDWLRSVKFTGVVNIVTSFKSSPYWPQIATAPGGEERFTEFVASFVSWEPGEAGAEAEADDEGVIDLTREGVALDA